MPIATSGGASNISSSQIVDGTIINADIAAAAAIAQSKIAAGLNANTDLFTIERTEGTTHSLTTLANQRVVVFVTGTNTDGTGTLRTNNVKYGGVTKATCISDGAGSATNPPIAMNYTEVPGAATADITVDTDGGTLSNVVILVLKFKSA